MDDNKKLRFFKTIAFFALSFSILILTWIVIINTYPIFISTIFPQNTHYTREIHLFYPDTYATTIPLMGMHEGGGVDENYENLSVDLLLQYDGVLCEGTPVSVTAFGFLYPNFNDTVTSLVTSQRTELPKSILIGFDSASSYDKSPNLVGSGSEFPLQLVNVDSIQYFNESQLKDFPISNKIIWSAQGEYSPYIVIPTHSHLIFADFPAYKIHVSGREVALQGEYSRISTLLAIVLYFFTLISGCKILYKIRPKWILKWLDIKPDSKISEDANTNDLQETPGEDTKINSNP